MEKASFRGVDIYFDDTLIVPAARRVVIMGEGCEAAQWAVDSDTNTVSNTDFATSYECSSEQDAVKICKALNDHPGHLLNFTPK